MNYTTKQLNTLWNHFLAFQAQFHARDFITLNPRDNKARFIKIIRTLVNHNFANLGINIELLCQPSTLKGIGLAHLTHMRKLCALIERGDAFALKEIDVDENASVICFKASSSVQWKAYIEAVKANKKEQGTDEEHVVSSKRNTRRRIDPLSALALDVDLQQQSEVENSFQIQSLQSIEHQSEQQFETPTSNSKNPAISFNEFWDLLGKDKSLQPIPISQDDLRYQWYHWSGGKKACHFDPQSPEKVPKRRLEEGDIQFTRDAAMELFKWRHLFQAGIDIHHLPAGFSITKSNNDKDTYLLDFLPKLKEIAEPDRLAIQCKAPLSFPKDTKPGLTFEDVKELFKEYHQVNEDSIKHLYEYALKYFPDKDTLQKNNDYMHAAQLILNLSPSQRKWWEQLFEQHMKHCGKDDFPSLVASFQEFLEQITQYHQYFDFYPPKFNNIKSMPIALTQMLALLDQSKNEDRQIQWNCITELHLTGYEVGKAIRSSYFSMVVFNEVQKPCSFILPNMGIEEIDVFKGKYDLLFPRPLDWFREDLPPEHAERLFYLALSHKQFRLPLSFYQEKIKAINNTNLDELSKKRLYNFLLESCTGTTSRFLLKEPDQIDSQWDLFMRNVLSLSNKLGLDKTNPTIEVLSKFTDIPEIDLLNKIMANINDDFQAELKNIVRYLNKLSEGWSTRKAHYLIEKKENTSLLHLWDMKVRFEKNYQPLDYLSLMRVFDLTPALNYANPGKPTSPGLGEVQFTKDFADVLEERAKDERSFFLSERILDKLSCLVLPKGKPYLTPEQFIAFSKAVFKEATQHQTQVIAKGKPEFEFYTYKNNTEYSFETFYKDSDFIDRILREQFPGYVDESLLELSELSTDDFAKLEIKIKARVKDKSAQAIMKSILTELSFDKVREDGHSDLVDKLITLINNYPGEERAEFLLSIKNHLAFGKLLSKESNRGYENRLDQLNELLQTVIDTGSITRFQFLIAEFETLSAPNNRNAIKKLSYTLSRLLGLMNAGLASNPHLQLTEQLVFCKEFISAHSANSLMQMSKTPQNNEVLFIGMVQEINSLSEKYPTHARALNSFFIRCYATMNKDVEQEGLTSSIQRTTDLCKRLSVLNDSDLVLPIIHTFVDENDAGLFSIQSLLSLFKSCPNEKLSEFFRILIGQINQNPKGVNKKSIDDFLSLMSRENNNAQFSLALAFCFSQLPIPSLAQFNDWWGDFQNNPTEKQNSIEEKYKAFTQQPFSRDEINNGFIVEKALQQVKSKEMTNIASRYTSEFINTFYKQCISLRRLSIADLMKALESAKNNSDSVALSTAMAELLFRSTGQEINTTQYLAIDAFLSSGKHVTSEIDTGEGKTRIAMLLLACRAYLDQTCDFVTSDMQLAETAYLSYNSFFKSLGIKCNLIRSGSNIEEYQVGAIHFSDCGNLSLFRNKATAAGQLHKALDPNPERRTLLLDESDKTWLDLYDISYNFSMSADKSLDGIDWVYTKLIEFFSEDGYRLNPEVMNYYYDDIELCNKKFREFVKTYGTKLQVAQLSTISDGQISRWHESAVSALSLRYQIDFEIEANARVRTDKGPKVASEALVVTDNQINRHSKFSNGVHQCLHARLNMLRHKDPHEQSRPLDRYLHSNCTQAFHIAPENQIIASSSSEAFLNFYSEGNTYGMTGTAGAENEKREIEEHFGIADKPDKKHFIKMPRHKENLRVDNPITIVSKNNDKIDLLVEHILLAQRKNQPVLVFCDNDREATSVTEQLNKRIQQTPDGFAKKISLNQIKSTTPSDLQRAYLANDAGKPGAVTISTGMLGRGKDILLHSIGSPKQDAAEYGLKTIDLSYPSYRELKQRLGRAARNGQLGETHILLSEEELKTKYKVRYSERNLKLIDSLLVKRQSFETDKNQLERRVKISLHEYLGQYQKAYFQLLLPLLKKHNINITGEKKSLWVHLFNELILMKQKSLNELMGIVHKPNFSVQALQLITDELHNSMQKKWDTLLSQLILDSAQQTEIKPLVNQSIHKMELQGWEKRRVLDIKNEQLRPFRAQIVTEEIKSNESFWIFLNRKLFEFAQWVSWDSLAKFLDLHFHFSRAIKDSEIEPLIYHSEQLDDESFEIYSIADALNTGLKNQRVSTRQPDKEPLHTDLFKHKAKSRGQGDKPENTLGNRM